MHGGIVVIKIARVERVEHVLGCDPPQAAGHGGANGHDVVDAQFGLHAVQLFKGSLGRGQGGEGRGIDAGLLQDLSVIAQAKALDADREANDLAFRRVVQVGILHPFGVGHISQIVFPQFVAADAFDHEDVGHGVGRHLRLQASAVISPAAQGLHRDGDTLGRV